MDELSYVAPAFKAGHTLPPLTCFSPTFFQRTYAAGQWNAVDGDGGIAADLADDWGYCIEFGRGLPSTWETDSFASDIANQYSQAGCVFKAVNDNPGRWKLACVTRSLLSWEIPSITESVFADESGGGSPVNYMIPTGMLQEGAAPVMLPGSLLGVTASGGVDYTGIFLRDDDGDIIRVYGRAQIKPEWCYSNASAYGGVSVPEAAARFVEEEVRLVTLMNAQLPVGNKLSVVRNGQEYPPSPWAGNNLPTWSKNRNITNLAEYIRNGGNAYKCITTGTTANVDGAGPTGTGADIVDGTVHWKFMYATNSAWRVDSTTRGWWDTLSALATNDDTLNNNFIDQLWGARLESETALKEAVEAVSPTTLYIYYSNVDIKEGFWDSGPYPGKLSASRRYGIRWGAHVGKTKDYSALPSPEFYRGYFPTWTSPGHGANESGPLPELVLNAVHSCIEAGQPLMYPFISGGWASSDVPPSYLSYDDQWMGFCKFLFMAGSLGVDYGYYGTPHSSDWVLNDTAGTDLRHALCVGHVQATFSHLEDYLRNGTLLEGDYDARGKGHSSHWLCDDVYNRHIRDFPSYEFAHDDDSQLYSKVIARKLNASNNWIICAWRCLDTGSDKTVHVTIAGHALTLNARRAGTLYHMSNTGTVTVLDPAGMDPSRDIATILAGL